MAKVSESIGLYVSPKDDATREIIIPKVYEGSRPMFGGSFALVCNTKNFVTEWLC